ncbi:8-oxo-dGTP diphosphatase [Nonomuraea fuscirosea]|uniref:8-oxo-dGTP diphosphatase n=1 Tax=Nonomuraea fuscirosea TaxID=1291556 RepID=A0A2T0MVR0_9ACTN|nr:8-oxo-dGTP diphosphatase [Nonomuraea fuscirosea]
MNRALKHDGTMPAAVTVDLVIFTVRAAALHVLLIERGMPPFEGELALPGGYVRAGEDLDQAALRELAEETGINGHELHLEQLRTFGAPERDPRGRTFTVAYLALGPDLPTPVAGTDAATACWVPVDVALSSELAFDHLIILKEGLDRARAKLEYTTVAAAFCRQPFTIADLRRVYEVIWGFPLDPSNFRRKVTKAAHFVEPTGESRTPEIGRPAALYRRGSAELLFPPMPRSADGEHEVQPSAATG